MVNTDSFRFGKCELFCGDYAKELNHVRNIRLVLTSPPYNIGSSGKRVDGLRKFGKFDVKSFSGITSYQDQLPEDIYQVQQKDFIRWALARLQPNGVIAYVHKNRHKNKKLISPYEWLLPLVSEEHLTIYEEIVWNRGSTHNHDKGYLYPETERIFILCKFGTRPYFRNYDPTGLLKGMSDIWRIDRPPRSPHDAAFPIELAKRVISCYSKPREIVMDPYSGSGTTFIAAHSLNRRFIGSELSRNHFNNSKKRIRQILEPVRNSQS
jgi:DNA modification methylase